MRGTEIDRILELAADPALAKEQLARFHSSFRLAFDRDPTFDGSCAAVIRLFGNTFLAEKLTQKPSWHIEYEGSPYFSSSKPREAVAEELSLELAKGCTEEDFKASLRLYKYKELARIAAKAFSKSFSEEILLKEWSDVADALISAAYDMALQRSSERMGQPLIDGVPCGGCVLALGKLGSSELNVSSDVDIIIVYGSDKARSSLGEKSFSSNEFFSSLTTNLTKILSGNTRDGFVFRVDHDLRPEGRSGALANSIDALESYYQYFGRDWERQMLVRARPIAGDIALGQKFIDAVRPFVYPRSISRADLTHLRDMKAKIERETVSARTEQNIKLGAGGIRELEFFVQALIQLFGGIHEELRTTSTFKAMSVLASENLVHPSTAKRLKAAYSFLRRTENCIQLESDLQTHLLPTDEHGMEQLARRFGYNGKASDFLAELNSHRSFIRTTFNSLFAHDYEREELVEAASYNLSLATSDEERADSLAWFKSGEYRRLRELSEAKEIPIPEILRRITLVADVTVALALKIAADGLRQVYGSPRLTDGKTAGFCIAAMGRFGSKEMDYHSDLDIIFLHEGEGSTDGKKKVSNGEYFTRLAQRVISLISLPTRYGKAYAIDSELRPSGRAGALVTSLEAFRNYHLKEAMLWERLSLLRMRAVAGDPNFIEKVSREHAQLAYERAAPERADACNEMMRLRKKVMDERVKRGSTSINLRYSDGCLYDLESAIQFMQLFAAPLHESLRVQNTLEALEALEAEALIDDVRFEKMRVALLLFRTLIMTIRLECGRMTEELKQESLNNPSFLSRTGFASGEELIEKLKARRDDVSELAALTFNTSPYKGGESTQVSK